MTVAIQDRLHRFATDVLQRRGALVEWDRPELSGSVLLPPELVEAVGAEDEVATVGCDVAHAELGVNLAGDFLDWSGRLLTAVPRVGSFHAGDLYLKRKGLPEAVQRAFTWLNGKARVHDSRQTTVEYHTWWFHAAATSEDRWESRVTVSLNPLTGAPIPLPDPLELWSLEANPTAASFHARSCETAMQFARDEILRMGREFFARMDGRRSRDRKRIEDYYGALLREAGRKKRHGRVDDDPEKIAAKKRAVQLELQRKLDELDERYATEVVLTPVLLVRMVIPVMAVELTLMRKKAQRLLTVYWNPLLKQFEPIRCDRCGHPTTAAALTNDTVAPLCPGCG